MQKRIEDLRAGRLKILAGTMPMSKQAWGALRGQHSEEIDQTLGQLASFIRQNNKNPNPQTKATIRKLKSGILSGVVKLVRSGYLTDRQMIAANEVISAVISGKSEKILEATSRTCEFKL